MVKSKIAGLLGLGAKAGKIVSGMDAVCNELSHHHLKMIILAEDASEKTKKEIQFLANQKGVPVILSGTIAENSQAIGKENRAIIGVKDQHIAEGMKKIICGGEAFGENENL